MVTKQYVTRDQMYGLRIAETATYQDYAHWNRQQGEREQLTKELDHLTHYWDDLSTQLDSQQSQISKF